MGVNLPPLGAGCLFAPPPPVCIRIPIGAYQALAAGLPACSLQAGWPANAPQQTRCVDLAISLIMVYISPFPDGGRGRCGGGLCLGREAGYKQAGQQMPPANSMCISIYLSIYGMHFRIL